MMRLLQAVEAVTEAENMGERFGNAGLNTLMGMGIVFIVLILISLIISAFSIIHKLEEKKAPGIGGSDRRSGDRCRHRGGNRGLRRNRPERFYSQIHS